MAAGTGRLALSLTLSTGAFLKSHCTRLIEALFLLGGIVQNGKVYVLLEFPAASSGACAGWVRCPGWGSHVKRGSRAYSIQSLCRPI